MVSDADDDATGTDATNSSQSAPTCASKKKKKKKNGRKKGNEATPSLDAFQIVPQASGFVKVQ